MRFDGAYWVMGSFPWWNPNGASSGRDFTRTGFFALASSIGIAEHRLAGLPIAVAQFTNFTQDHLDYHGGMDAYWAAKRILFDWPGLKSAVINTDDPQDRKSVV